MSYGAPTIKDSFKEREKALLDQMGLKDMHSKANPSIRSSINQKGYKKLAKKARIERLAEEQ